MTSERPAHPFRQGAGIALAAAVCTPSVVLRVSGTHPPEWAAAVIFGIGVVGAAFMLSWAAEVIQLDISAGLALALLALIAVLPEYAVDFVFTWKAGKNPDHASYALANMTGGNQLLIGAGWSFVVLLATWRIRRLTPRGATTDLHGSTGGEIVLERSHSVEIAFLAAATIYGLTLPLRRTLSLVDAVVLVAIFAAYLIRISGAPAEEPHLVGPAQLMGTLAPRRRRQVVAALFIVSAAVILAAAEPFAESLVETGKEFGIDEFLLVKWLAPLASEAPELLVAGMYAWRLNTNSALGALVSSKVNQWTLLVGTLPVVFALSSGAPHGLPIGTMQREELFVTAAQSAFAVAILASRSINVREAQILLALFLAQLVLGGVLPGGLRDDVRIGVGIIYLALGLLVVARDMRALPRLLRDGFRTPYSELGRDAAQPL